MTMSLENTVRQWLTRDEELEFILEERYWSSRSCLAITSVRAVLFTVGLFRRMRETKDRLWRQLEDVYVKEHFRSADLTISFLLPHADCLVHHDPHEEENHKPKCEEWPLSYLRRGEAKEAYRLLKAKERVWKGNSQERAFRA